MIDYLLADFTDQQQHGDANGLPVQKASLEYPFRFEIEEWVKEDAGEELVLAAE